jgi:plastocyanin domain-containing protein
MSEYSFRIGIVWMVLLATFSTGTIQANRRPRIQGAKVRINERGFEPTKLRLRRGIPARVTFLRTTEATCAKEVVLPDFNIRRALPLNQPVNVSFIPRKKGSFTFVCGMNMMRGQLIVQ